MAPDPFSPHTLGPLTLKNRFIKAATFEGVPLWKALQNIEPPTRKAEMADPSRRGAYRHAIDNPNLETAPLEFVSPGPAGSVERRVPVRKASDQEVPAVPDALDENKPTPENP